MSKSKKIIPISKKDPLKMLGLLADGLLGDGNLTESERHYLGNVLKQISAGVDANQAFDLKRGRGNSKTNETNRKRLSLIMMWIAALYRDKDNLAEGEKPPTLEEVCTSAAQTVVPFAKALFPGADDRAYDPEYLMQCWHKPEYAHMRSPIRSPLDLDSPLS